MANSNELFVKMVLNEWNFRLQQADKLFTMLSDEQLQGEVSPGRNRGIYLLGHLVAVHDRMIALLGLGERQYAKLDDAFIENPDKAVAALPTVAELRTNWTKVNSTLAGYFSSMTADDWFKKHTSVSEEDFAKEPHRNRINVLISRSNHLSYHLGQMALLKNDIKKPLRCA
ncbi:MAG: hypothetical protein JWO06_839 [Bacteroidota bacterium]|nr:hypothetical protein [Bacteroidota bacterium]